MGQEGKRIKTIMNEPNKEVEEIKGRDISPALIAKWSKPKKTWFIMRMGDKKIFAMEEMEAWKTLTNKSNWVRHDFKIIGVSDGETYAKVIADSKKNSAGLAREMAELETEINKYRKTEDRFVFDDLLDKDDPKVIRVKEIIKDLEEKYDVLNKKYIGMTRDVATLAFEAELAVARTNKKVFPSNQDIMTPGSNPKERRKILKNMGELDDDD